MLSSQLLVKLSRLPLLTFPFAILAVAAYAFPTMNGIFVYDRMRMASGEPWRAATGHFTHWNGDHLLWDVLMFAVLGATLELRSRRALAFNVICSAAAISAALWMWRPDIAEYRGLSGIDSALFVHVAVLTFLEARDERNRLLTGAIGAALIGFVAKLGLEMLTGTTLFVDSTTAGFIPLPLAHIVGGVIGLGLALAKRQHVVAKLFDPFDRHGIVNRSPNPADRAVALQVD